MKIKFLISLFALLMVSELLLGQELYSIQGTVLDEKKEPLAFAILVLKKDSVSVQEAQADFDGLFRIDSLEAGIYNIEIRYVGCKTLLVEGIVLSEHLRQSFSLESLENDDYEDTYMGGYWPSFIFISYPASGGKQTLQREDFMNNASFH